MTTIRTVEVRCALCGTMSFQTRVYDAAFCGPPDLDLRPGEPARSLLALQVQRCARCGYCWPAIGEALPGAGATVDSMAYKDVLLHARMPRLARYYCCAALVAEAAEERELSARFFLDAAWACDDLGAEAQARTCRERSAEMFLIALEWGECSLPEPVARTVVGDVLRRAGRLSDAVASTAKAEQTLQHAGAEDDNDDNALTTAAVAAYVRGLAELEDDTCRNIADAFAE
jgi:ribosomal protein L37E